MMSMAPALVACPFATPRDRRAVGVCAFVAAALLVASVSSASSEPSSADTPAVPDAGGQTGRLLSAFFGLDDALPFGAHLLCLGAAGRDGMPVVFSHPVDEQTLDAEDFRVFTRSGAESTPRCVTLRPSVDEGERRTVLLIGEFGDADGDPPKRVEVVGELSSDGSTGGAVSYRGLQVEVTPLYAGPSLVLAEVAPRDEWSVSGRGTTCPADSRQVIRATWAGGVRPAGGGDAGEVERALYRVTVERADGTRAEIVPAALADLGDNDNNHHLCLDTTDPAVAVAFPGGHLVDPNEDRNPDTSIRVERSPGIFSP